MSRLQSGQIMQPTAEEVEMLKIVQREAAQQQVKAIWEARWHAVSADLFTALAADHMKTHSEGEDEKTLGPLALRCIKAAHVLNLAWGVKMSYTQPPGIPGVKDPAKK